LTVDISELGLNVEPLGADAVDFANDAIRFLSSHADRVQPATQAWGEGPEHLTIFHESTGDEELAEAASAKAWQAVKWAAGFGWITGPREFGGRGLDASYERIYRSIEALFEVPDWSPLRIGLSTVGPGIVASGSPAQIRDYAVPIQQGISIACQLFSEPDAGSDLSAVRTKATRDGEIWRLEGQKVWTSNAQFADFGLALVRTDPSAPKHQGLTVFVVPMHQPGVEVRPIRQLTGGASFTEVFFDGAEVTDDQRIGAEGDGWRVAVTALTAERASTGDRSHGLNQRAFTLLCALAARTGAVQDPLQRQRLADIAIRLRIAHYYQLRMQATPLDQLKGPERAIDKLMLADNLRRIGEVAGSILGPRFAADTGEWGTFAWSGWMLGALGYRFGGGTSEILKTMLGERLLGLPKEPR
jgi:alkylation response protein AidB-like acyl-CoA dehydrogenase